MLSCRRQCTSRSRGVNMMMMILFHPQTPRRLNLSSLTRRPKPPQASVLDLLDISQSKRRDIFHISGSDTILSALQDMATHHVSGLVVVDHSTSNHSESKDPKKEVLGILYQKQIIREMAKLSTTEPHESPLVVLQTRVQDVCTPARDIIYLSPNDSLEDARAVMSLSGLKFLPVLSSTGRVLGVVSLTDIAMCVVDGTNTTPSAKADYITMILPRKGLPRNTSLVMEQQPSKHEPTFRRSSNVKIDDGLKCHKNIRATTNMHPLRFETAVANTPHPSKVHGEDAYFLLNNDDDRGDLRGSYFGVADGVGSWFERDVDPSCYAKELMQAAQNVVNEPQGRGGGRFLHPFEILHQANHLVQQQEIVGSSTACIIGLDPVEQELHASNLGDSGFVIVRDKRSDRQTASVRGTLDGSLHNRTSAGLIQDDQYNHLTPAGRRKGAHISYRSPQQLHYFNCPYQLGHDDVPAENDPHDSVHQHQLQLFEQPTDASQLRVPIFQGDLIICATDGLFDNMDERTLLRLVMEYPDDVQEMATHLVAQAKALSLQQDIDSPFARLAKENDILWSGGMPDDITVIVARVMKN